MTAYEICNIIILSITAIVVFWYACEPIKRLVEEAKKKKDKWPPLQVGMFDGSLDRFFELSDGLKQRINELSWL